MKPTGPEMNIGNAGRRPKLKPWIVLLKWFEMPEGHYISHDFRWAIEPTHEGFQLLLLNPNDTEWNGEPKLSCYGKARTPTPLFIHAQDYSDGFRKHVWESIHGKYTGK